MANLNDAAPQKLDDYSGQEKAIRKLKVHIAAAKMRNEKLPNILLTGNSGLGKSTLANCIANEMGANLRTILCSSVSNIANFISSFLSIEEGDMVFLDEIHSLSPKMSELTFGILENNEIHGDLGDGEIISYKLPSFTVIGATTNIEKLLIPQRNRFQIVIDLIPYKINHIADIIKKSCKYYRLKIDDETAAKISNVCKGSPRLAKNHIIGIRDYATVCNNGVIDYNLAKEVLAEENGLDIETGLDDKDRRYLRSLFKTFSNKPVGLETIASSMNENSSTLEKIVEPYLIRRGFVMKTPRGRCLTEEGIKIIK